MTVCKPHLLSTSFIGAKRRDQGLARTSMLTGSSHGCSRSSSSAPSSHASASSAAGAKPTLRSDRAASHDAASGTASRCEADVGSRLAGPGTESADDKTFDHRIGNTCSLAALSLS